MKKQSVKAVRQIWPAKHGKSNKSGGDSHKCHTLAGQVCQCISERNQRPTNKLSPSAEVVIQTRRVANCPARKINAEHRRNELSRRLPRRLRNSNFYLTKNNKAELAKHDVSSEDYFASDLVSL